MRKKIVAALAASLFAAGAACATPADFTVNGEKITAQAQEQLLQAAAAQGQERTPELEEAVKNRLIAQTLLVQEANRSKLDRNPLVARAIAESRAQILSSAAITSYVKAHPVTEEEIQAAYDKQKREYGDTEYRVRHILVSTEAEAEKALSRLKAGEDFAKLAEELSMDPGSKANGGDLDWASPSMMVPPFAEAMRTQKTGEVSAKPVKTQFGYHILKVEASRPAELFPALEHAKPQIRQGLTQERVNAYIESLRSKAVIK